MYVYSINTCRPSFLNLLGCSQNNGFKSKLVLMNNRIKLSLDLEPLFLDYPSKFWKGSIDHLQMKFSRESNNKGIIGMLVV